MLIVCPSCLSAYRLPPASVRAPDAVRCLQCGTVFQASASIAVPMIVASDPTVAALPRPAPILAGQRSVRSLPLPVRKPSASRQRTGPWLMAATVLLGLGTAAALGRTRLVQALPSSATMFAALGPAQPGLRLGSVQTALGDEGPVKVLTLQASITNTRSIDTRLPNMRIVVRDSSEQNLYSWTAPAPRATLGPNEVVAFSSRLVSPPPNGHDLVVSFADPSDGLPSIERETKP